MTFEQMFDKYWEFADKQFDTTPAQATNGLIREAKELEREFNPMIGDKEQSFKEFTDSVLEESADVQFYLLYILKRSGFNYKDFINAMDKKLEVLKTRTWKKDETGCYSHVNPV